MRVVLKSGGVSDLKRQIIQDYVIFLKGQLKMNESILADKDWASGGDDYHRQCRIDMENVNKNINLQLEMLGKYHITRKQTTNG